MDVGSVSKNTSSGAMKAMTDYMSQTVNAAVTGTGQASRAQAEANAQAQRLIADRSAVEQASVAQLLAGKG